MVCEVFELDELVVELHQVHEALRCKRNPEASAIKMLANAILHTIIFHRALGLLQPKTVDSELFDISYVQCAEIDVVRRVDERISQFAAWLERHPTSRGLVCLSFFKPQAFDAASRLSLRSSPSPHELHSPHGPIPAPSSSSFPSSPSSPAPRGRLSTSPSSSSSPSSPSSWFSTPRRLAFASSSSDGPPWEQWLIPMSLVHAAPHPVPSSAQHGSGDASSTTAAPAAVGSSIGDSARVGSTAAAAAVGPTPKQVEAALRATILAILQAMNQRLSHIPPVLTTGPLSFPFDISINSTGEPQFSMEVLKRILHTAPPGVLG